MANTFKQFTLTNVTSQTTLYTAGSGVSAIVLSLMLANTTSGDATVTVEVGSDTANRTGANDTANVTTNIVHSATISANNTLEVVTNKLVLETTDTLKITSNAALNVSASIMEIT